MPVETSGTLDGFPDREEETLDMRERPLSDKEKEKMRVAWEQIRPFIRPSSSSSSPKQENPCSLGRYHQDMKTWAAHYLSAHRSEIGIEDPWSLLVEVVCPSSSFFSLSSHAKEHEAQIEWDSEVWFARVSLCCNLPFDLRQWVLIHELYELKHWRTGDAFHSLVSLLPPSELRDMVIHQFYQARNQEIEQEVGQYLGQRRPNHITTSSQPQPQNDERKGNIPPPPDDISLQTPEEFLGRLRPPAWREEAEEDDREVGEPNILTLTEEEMENIRL